MERRKFRIRSVIPGKNEEWRRGNGILVGVERDMVEQLRRENFKPFDGCGKQIHFKEKVCGR